MAVLYTSYNEENTVKTEIRSVEHTNVSKTHKIIKSTDTDLPDGLVVFVKDGNIIDGVWEVEGTYYAMVLTFVITLEDIVNSKIEQANNQARSNISKIDVLSSNTEEQKASILADLESQLEVISNLSTIQDAEAYKVEVVDDIETE